MFINAIHDCIDGSWILHHATYHGCHDQGEYDYDDQQRDENATPIALARIGGH